MSPLQVDHLTKVYQTGGGPLVALDDISLSVRDGELLVVLGPSGCGKSTLLQIVAGLEQPTSGTVTMDGALVQGCASNRTMISQRPSLFPWLNARDNVAFGLRVRGHSDAEQGTMATHALEKMGLGDYAELWPHQLSGGMQQRIALARALVLDPDVILMDEPFAAVDTLRRASLQREICSLCSDRKVLFVTHSIREALVIGDRILILSARPGRILADIRPEGTRPRPFTPDLAEAEAELESLLESQYQDREQPDKELISQPKRGWGKPEASPDIRRDDGS